MKKLAKKLNLNRETIRSLDLRQAGGAGPEPSESFCTVICTSICENHRP